LPGGGGRLECTPVMAASQHILFAENGPKLTDWLTAVGGLLVAAATAGLVVFAYHQLRITRRDAQDAIGRAIADVDAATKRSDASVTAALEIAEAVAAAAERQWAPRVVAHFVDRKDLPSNNPETGEINYPDYIELGYYLSNDGTGPAFNIAHWLGTDTEGRVLSEDTSPRPRDIRTLQAGEQWPPDAADGKPGLITVRLKRSVPRPRSIVQVWTEYENLAGEEWRLRCYGDESRPQRPKRISERHRLD